MRTINLVIILLFAAHLGFGQSGLKDRDISELAEKIKAGRTSESLEAILAAGRSGNKNYIPFLRTVADAKNETNAIKTVASYSQVALAILGEKKYLSSILQQVDSIDIYEQNLGIEKLSLVGGSVAYKVFFRLLDDVQIRREGRSAEEIEYARIHGFTLRTGDEFLEPRSILVMQKLSGMAIDSPIPPGSTPSLNDIKIWKKWFERHWEIIR